MSKCVYCFEKDHTISSCELARKKGEALHQELCILIAHRFRYRDIHEFVETYMNYINSTHLDCIVLYHGKKVLKEFSEKIYLMGGISREVHKPLTGFDNRKKLAVVLAFFYYDYSITNQICNARNMNYNHIKTKIAKTKMDTISFDCPICYSEVNSDSCVLTNCNHAICADCFSMIKTADIRRKPLCFYCRTPLKCITFQDTEKRDEYFTV